MSARQEIEAFARTLLDERLTRLRPEQLAKFHFLYPKGVPGEKIENAIDICDRTIRKNVAGRPTTEASVEEAT